MFLINRFIIGSRHGSLCIYFSQDFLPFPCSWRSLASFTRYFFSRSLIVLISIELCSLWSYSTGTIFRQSLILGCLEKGTAETPRKEHKHTFLFSAVGWGKGGGFPSQIHASSHPSELNFHQQQTWPHFSQSLSKHALESTKPCRTQNSSTARPPHHLKERTWDNRSLSAAGGHSWTSSWNRCSGTSCNLFWIISHMCRKRTELLLVVWAEIRC